MMTSTEISHVALQYYAYLSFADAQLLVKFPINAIFNSVNNTILIMLRHDNDVEAESKPNIKYFVL